LLQLRYYQDEAVSAVYNYLRNETGNPCVVLPTAAGKTPVIARLATDCVTKWHGRCLILSHVKELLEQSEKTLKAMCPELDIGVFSAGLNRRDTDHSVVCAGVQSVYRRACDLGRFDLVIVDEGHLIPPDGDGMYQTLLSDLKTINPNVRVIVLTATPYRLDCGHICGPDKIATEICYEIGVKQLIAEGYLCPLLSRGALSKVDSSSVGITRGEYDQEEAETAFDRTVRDAVGEMIELMTGRHSILVFAQGVKHAQHIVEQLKARGENSVGFVCGDKKITSDTERARLVAEFRDGLTDLFGERTRLRWLVNVGCFTTGFDAPCIDGVVLMRMTMSGSLVYQMVGRGFRKHDSKTDCLILDYGENLVRHGPVDAIKVPERSGPRKAGAVEAAGKECLDCHEVISAGYGTCPKCGHKFPREESHHANKAGRNGVISGQVTDTWWEVNDIVYTEHRKKNDPDARPTMRVTYKCSLTDWHSEWVCIEHEGYARKNAIKWWGLRTTEPYPQSVKEAVDLAKRGALSPAKRILVRETAGDKFAKVAEYELGEMPSGLAESEEMDAEATEMWVNGVDPFDDVPF